MDFVFLNQKRATFKNLNHYLRLREKKKIFSHSSSFFFLTFLFLLILFAEDFRSICCTQLLCMGKMNVEKYLIYSIKSQFGYFQNADLLLAPRSTQPFTLVRSVK